MGQLHEKDKILCGNCPNNAMPEERMQYITASIEKNPLQTTISGAKIFP